MATTPGAVMELESVSAMASTMAMAMAMANLSVPRRRLAMATVAFAAARATRLALRRVLTLARFRRRRPVRIGRLSTAAIGVETADVFPKRCFVHIQHVAPTPTLGPGGVGTHKQQQETVAKSGTHLGSATAPGPEWGRLARDAFGTCRLHVRHTPQE